MSSKNIITIGLVAIISILFYFLSQNLFLKNNSDKISAPITTLKSTPLPIQTETDTRVMLDEWRPERFRSPDALIIKKAIPTNAFLRDFALLKNEDAFLALYVLNPILGSEKSVMDYSERTGGWFPAWCGAGDFGQTISGIYKLALVRGGQIVNEVDIPFPDFDKWPDHKFEKPDPESGAIGYMDTNDPKGVWKNQGALMFRHARCILDGSAYVTEDAICKDSGMDFLETRQLQLVDLTGDKLPHEVRFMTEYISCGNLYYVIAGYDKATDKVMIYPIIDVNGEHPSYDDFDPRADGTVIHDTGCDHGANSHTITYFKFDQERKNFVLQESSGSKNCWE